MTAARKRQGGRVTCTATPTPTPTPRVARAGTGDAIWVDVCPVEDLTPDRGACALVRGEQVALFRLAPEGALHAVSNHDPFTGVGVISRGRVGSRGDVPKVVSPLRRHAFALTTGECFDDPAVRLRTYAVRVRDGVVQVAAR